MTETRRTLRSPGELADAGLIAADRAAALAAVAARYAVAVTPQIAALIDRDDADDPIARQFLPDARELDRRAEERDDPIGDARFSPVRGVVHRYPDRALLAPLMTCPVYCRHCFRREAVGPAAAGRPAALTPAELDAALGYIAAQDGIWEVILTGGDPFALGPRRLAAVVGRLAAIGHVEVIRVHTRVPVADPGRVTPDLVRALDAAKAVYVVLHCNHARELSDAAAAACARIVRAGIPMLAQTVLLRGVNDDAAALEALMRALVRNRIKPYYLHHADLANGTAHFRTSIAEGQALIGALRRRASGLCQPAYVLDIPGGHGKVPVGPCHAEGPDADGRWRVTDPGGGVHRYP